MIQRPYSSKPNPIGSARHVPRQRRKTRAKSTPKKVQAAPPLCGKDRAAGERD